MRVVNNIALVLFFLLSTWITLASETDSISLQKEIANAKNDEQKVGFTIQLAKYHLANNLQKSMSYAKSAETLSQKINYKKGLGDAACVKGEVEFLLANYNEAKKYFIDAIAFYDKDKDANNYAEACEGLGKVAYQSGEHDAALTHFSEAMQIFEKNNYKNGLSGLYINLGLLYEDSGNQQQAIDFYQKSIKIAKEINDLVSESSCYTNLGNIYTTQKKYDLGVKTLEKSLELKRALGNKKGEGTSLNNLGATYYEMGNIDKALEYFQAAYDIYISINDKKSSFPSCNNIGSIYYEQQKYDKALVYYNKAYELAKELGSLSKKILCLENLALLYKDMGNAAKALDYSIECWQMKDTLYNREQAEINAEMQTKFSTEKKQQENEILNLQLKSESFVKMIFIIAACLLGVLVFFIFRGLRQKQKVNKALEEKNKIIEEQKQTVEHQKHIVEEQNKDIKDSIKYAERIQQAILPPEQLWFSLLPQSFVFYKPKDILSGDFYWIEQKGDLVFVAAADCTGHGVPGALISIVNYNLLNKAVLEKELHDPADILNYVNSQLTVALHQTYQESSVRDGMDISLCAINMKTLEVEYAGANNPIYVFKQQELIQLNADKFPVGAFVEEKIQSFQKQTIQLQKGDSLYLFSDGYADQFGGPKGKKFKYQQLKNLLIEYQNHSMEQQHDVLAKALIDWQGNLEQIDDVLVIGIKL